MKKILLATALIGFAFTQTNAQNPASVSTKKDATTGVKSSGQVANEAKPAANAPANATAKPAAKPAPAAKEAPASVKNGKQVMHKEGTHGSKAPHAVKENKDAAKPMAPGGNDKK